MSTTFIPNTFQTPNAIVDVLMPLLKDSEFRVLMFLTRHILGWRHSADSKRARISQTTIENGYSYRDKHDKEHHIPGCGLSRKPIQKALQILQTYRIIKAIGKPGSRGQEWELILLTEDNPDVEGLKLRQNSGAHKARKQIANARKVMLENREQETSRVVQLPQQQGSPTTIERGSPTTIVEQGSPTTIERGSPTTIERGSPTTTNEYHKETHKETHTIAAKQPEEKTSASTSKELTKAQRDEWYSAVRDTLGIYGGQNGDYQKMLRGEATKQPYKDYNLEMPITPQQFREWGKWYREHELKNNSQLSMVKDPAKIQSSLINFMNQQPTKPEPKPEPNPVEEPLSVQIRNALELRFVCAQYFVDKKLKALGLPVGLSEAETLEKIQEYFNATAEQSA